MWGVLRNRRFVDYKFRRQVPIAGYVADFVCYSLARLIVDLDGSQHAENPRDAVRDAVLASQGFRILRVWNNELTQNRQGVLEAIWAALVPPHPALPRHLHPQGEGRDIVDD